MAATRFRLLPENRLAYESAVSVRDGATRTDGVLTICGPPGSGKSALLNAVFGLAAGREKLRTVHAWVEGTKQADRDGSPAAFATRLAREKCLVLEDLSALRSHTGRPIVDRFCDLLDVRRERGLPTVLTADAAPGPLLGVANRLTDRLQGGLVAAIEPLSETSRTRLAADLAVRFAVRATEDQFASVADLLGETAGEVETAVREIESLTIRRQSDVNEALLTEFRRRNRQQKPTISAIARQVAKEFSAKVSDLRADGRTQAVVLPRQTAMFLARTLADEPYQAIGRYFGGRNHSTVVHSVKRIERMLGDSAELASRVSSIRSQLSG